GNRRQGGLHPWPGCRRRLPGSAGPGRTDCGREWQLARRRPLARGSDERGPGRSTMSAQLWQQITWDVARAGGMVAYILLTRSVALGLALSMRWQRPRWPRLFTNEMHSFLTLLSLVFIAVHV